MKHAHPKEISIRGFDASHLLPVSTNRPFRLNGKQPTSCDVTNRTFFRTYFGLADSCDKRLKETSSSRYDVLLAIVFQTNFLFMNFFFYKQLIFIETIQFHVTDFITRSHNNKT